MSETVPRALSGRPEAEIGSGLAPALCVRCYRRKRAQGGAMGHNDKCLTGEVIPDRIAVIQAFLQAADPYLRFSRVSGSGACHDRRPGRPLDGAGPASMERLCSRYCRPLKPGC